MTEQARIMTERRRSDILIMLAQDSDYSINDNLLQEMLALQGDSVSTDKLRTELAWLAEQDLVGIKSLPGCLVVTLRRRGVEVAQGVVVVPGVARPRAA